MKVAAIHYSYYPQDTRPRREAEALVDAGMSVDTICLRLREQIPNEKVKVVEVNRMPVQINRDGKLSCWRFREHVVKVALYKCGRRSTPHLLAVAFVLPQ